MNPAAYRIDGRLVERAAFYNVACDPSRSVAVEACAGAGKTWMLVSRILRALLDGAAPQDILAITFTKKAAGEMRQRLQDWLREFAGHDDERLLRELVLRGLAPDAARARAADLRGLHARLLADGRPVQIRTFHSWFAALLRSAPLSVLQDLGLPAEHELLEDDAEAVALVWPRFFATVAAEPALHQDFMDSVARHGRHQTLKALKNALDKRVEFALADEAGIVDASVQPFAVLWPSLAGHQRPEEALLGDAVRARWLDRARELGAEKNKTPQKAGDAVVDAFLLPDTPEAAPQRLAALRKAFFVATDDRLTQHLTKYPAAQAAEAELQPLLGAVRQQAAWAHQQRLARLTRALLAEYRALKRERGWVDMNDVEGAARRLLGDAELSGWMQQRLDARVRHLLIDEFQDTNPLQWQALYGWLSGYAGAGAGEAPSVFLVGDPKQSIYRFRRAEPQVFRAAQAFVVQGLSGALLSCDHTRRCATGVIDTLNAVMGGAAQDAGYNGFRPHTTESGEPGAVLALPSVSREEAAAGDTAVEADGEDAWRDSLATPRVTPEDSLSAREAAQAADWIAAELADGHLRAGDLMVLSRKRERLGWLHEALAERGIAAEQPEKLDLSEAPAVQDVVALLDALVSPAHDLSLARALRSPIFGLDDAALARVARLVRRIDAAREQGSATQAGAAERTTWWDALQALDAARSDDPQTDAGLAAAAAQLGRWRQWLQTLPPHDALTAIYRDGDLLARYAAAMPARLRTPVLASLRALLAQSLAQDGGRYLTAYRFVRALKAGGIRLHAAVQADAVRLLTIHGAKGLEAHTVLLLDTDSLQPPADSMGVLVDWPGEAERPQRFVFLASEKTPPACAQGLLAAEQQARALEELNALYVALTRAEARVVVSSVQPHRQGSAPSWRARIEPLAQPVTVPLPVVPGSGGGAPADEDGFTLAVLPRWSVAAVPAVAVPAAPVDEERTRIGLALHRLLQWLPTPSAGFDWGDGHRQAVAREFALGAAQAQEALRMAQTMRAGEAAWLWDATQLAYWGNEVDIALDGQPLRLDRLVRRRDDGSWWVIDFKSATRPERQAGLREQLQRYHRALSQAHPGDPVRLAFLNPLGQLIEIPAEPNPLP